MTAPPAERLFVQRSARREQIDKITYCKSGGFVL